MPGKSNAQANIDSIKFTRYIYPDIITPGSAVTVTLVINKGYRGGFAKLQEFIPKGFKASEGDKNGGNFIVTDTVVTFNWEMMPEDPAFTVSYHLIVPAKALGNYSLSAQFTCPTRDGNATIVFKPGDIMVQNAAPKPKQVVLKPEKSSQPAKPVVVNTPSTPLVVKVPAKAVVIDTVSKPSAPVVVSTPVPQQTAIKPDTALQRIIDRNNALLASIPAPASKTLVPAGKTATPVVTQTSASITTAPVKVNGDLVCLRVQIMASAVKMPVDSVILNDMRDKLYINAYNGVYRYSVGQFVDVKSAIDYREKIKNVGLPGPFVVAYKNETRITIKEALALIAESSGKLSAAATQHP